MIEQHQDEFLPPPKEFHKTFQPSGTVKKCCLHFFYYYYGYEWTQYCYPGTLLCENEENQFHFPKERLKYFSIAGLAVAFLSEEF